MNDTAFFWHTLNNPQSDMSTQTPVESSPDLKESIPNSQFFNDIAALSQKFPQLTSLLATNKNEQGLILEISLKEIFILCPRGRCRLDRYSKLQKYLKENYNTTLIIKSQKTK